MKFQCPTKLWRLTNTLDRAGKAYRMSRQYTAYLRNLAAAVHKEAYELGFAAGRRYAAKQGGHAHEL